MPRLLHLFSQRPGRSGSGVYLKAMAAEAARRGYEQQGLYAGPPGTTGEELPPVGADGVEVVEFPSPEAPFPVPGMSDVMPYPSSVFSRLTKSEVDAYLATFRRAMVRVRERFRPDVVHAHHLWLLSALAGEVFDGVPVVATSHNSELRQLEAKANHLAPRVVPGIRRLDRIGALTPCSRDDIVRAYGVERGRVEIVGAGFRDDLFRPPEVSREEILGRLEEEHGLALPADEALVTFVGRLSSPKGVPQLLEAVRHLRRSGAPPFRLVLLAARGSGEDGERMEAMARREDGAIASGAVPQEAVALVLQASDVFVLPSLYEGLPLVMLEAAACGVPSVLSELPTVASWVPDAWRESGCFAFVPPLATTDADCPVEADVSRYVVDLAVAIGRFLVAPPTANERRRFAQLAAGESWSAVFERYEGLYRMAGV